MKTVSVVIPILNGADTLDALFGRFATVEADLQAMGISLHFILVDDGSTDRTYAGMLDWKQRKKNISVVKLSRNWGAIAASNAGLKHVKGDAFTLYSSDLQDPPELIPEMCRRWQEGKKFIICQRAKERKDPFLTRLYARLYYKLVKWLVMDQFPETGFDIFLLDAAYLPYLQHTGKNINRSLYTYWLGLNPEIITYNRPQRHSGKSKWTFSRKVKLFIDSFLGFSMKPIRLFIMLGLIVSALSFVYGTVVVAGALLGNISVPGYASLAVILSFMFGLVFLLLGVIAEYLWRIFDEVNKRPESVVETYVE